jgi:malonyl-CoA decarboxylase
MVPSQGSGSRPGAGLDVLFRTTEVLLAQTSETASMALAEQVVLRYAGLPATDRLGYLTFLLERLGPLRSNVELAIEAYRAGRTETALSRLARATESARKSLFRAINTAPGGTWTVLTMRADLLGHLVEHPELEPVEADLFDILSSWFNLGFILLKRIDWRSPGAVLERLIEYEAVHEIRGWGDLRRRLEADRRCFGFFHPVIPDEPLIFIEVALTEGLARSVQDLIDAAPPVAGEPTAADTATFYSITNCQPGLRGIQLGHFLINQVARMLAVELPQIRQFATISPVPGFARWLGSAAARELFSPREQAALDELGNGSWHQSPQAREALCPLLLRSCAHYLVNVKQGRYAADSVARFHLRNGARLERINWQGDTSANGLRQLHGILVNYVYDETQIAANHEAYVHDGVIAHGPEVGDLLAGRPASAL